MMKTYDAYCVTRTFLTCLVILNMIILLCIWFDICPIFRKSVKRFSSRVEDFFAVTRRNSSDEDDDKKAVITSLVRSKGSLV